MCMTHIFLYWYIMQELIFSSEELEQDTTTRKIRVVQTEGREMNKTGFTNIKDINDEYIVWRGTSFLFLPTKKGLECGCLIPNEGLIYILASNGYLVCLSSDEEGNISSHLDFGNNNYAIGKEIKRMLLSDLQDVYLSQKVKYTVEIAECI